MVRKARPSDAKKCVKILDLAMDDISGVILNETDYDKKIEKFETFFRAKNNRLSYENTIVYEDENKNICGAMIFYKGYESDFLDAVFNERLKQLGSKNLTKKECEDDEFYIDSVAVDPKFRGKGYFKALMNEAIQIAKNSDLEKMSLVTHTPELYTQFGFKFHDNLDIYGEVYQKMIKVL